jgi:hypothetical protein
MRTATMVLAAALAALLSGCVTEEVVYVDEHGNRVAPPASAAPASRVVVSPAPTRTPLPIPPWIPDADDLPEVIPARRVTIEPVPTRPVAVPSRPCDPYGLGVPPSGEGERREEGEAPAATAGIDSSDMGPAPAGTGRR